MSSSSSVVEVEALYRINGFILTADRALTNTTSSVEFRIKLKSTANVPMNDVNISINYNYGNPDYDTKALYIQSVVPSTFRYDHLFDLPGEYQVNVNLTNVLNEKSLSVDISVWDSLLDLDFVFVNGTGEYITNTSSLFEFTGVPPFGYNYQVNYGDGTIIEDQSEDILYNRYNLTIFSHVYTSAGTYTLTWTATNGNYSRQETINILVQNKVPAEGYIPEPYGQKYPWLNMQTMSISVNFTLNDSVPLPTDATCDFNADDGTDVVKGINYDASFINHYHLYTEEGTFNTTMNCSNRVSDHTYNFLLTVEKYQASYLSLVFEQVIPLNKSDSIVVDFHIDSGGFALIPEDVTLTWNFEANILDSNETTMESFDRTPVQNEYFHRGDYQVDVQVYVASTNTSIFLSYPLRIGVMRFDYTGTIAFIDYTTIRYTMYGIDGLTGYTLEFGDGTLDGTCSSTGNVSCYIDHLCPEYGYKLVQARGDNGTFVELDDVNITCDNPMDNLGTDIPREVVIPDGIVHAFLRIPETDLPLPVVDCDWNMGDPIKRDTYRERQSVTFTEPFNFTFQYIPVGRFDITIKCWNLINETFFKVTIKVTNEDFLFTGVFDRFYSQEYMPMLISAMADVSIFSRLEILADSYMKTHTNDWRIKLANTTSNLDLSDNNRHGLLLTRGQFPENKYKVTLLVGFTEQPDNFLFEPTFIELVMPPPHAMIVGDHRRVVKKESVTVDAVSLSYDPVYPDNRKLTFTWECRW